MAVRITLTYQGVETIRDFASDELSIGRPDGVQIPALDLSPDARVSRQHAVLQVKDGVCWITDLGSRFGTQVDGREIRGQGEWRLWPENVVLIGETALRFAVVGNPKLGPPRLMKAVAALPSKAESPGAENPGPGPGKIAAPTGAVSPEPITDFRLLALPKSAAFNPLPLSEMRIVQMIDTDRPVPVTPAHDSTAERRLAMLLNLPLQFSAQSNLSGLFQTVMTRVVEVIPSARRGALLLRDAQQDTLLLKAYVSANEPAVSETLARRAMSEKRGISWRSGESADPDSVREFQIVSGLYAPLYWKEHVYGVICVDSPEPTDSFREEDLQFLMAIGQYTGMALAEQNLTAELQRNTKLVERLLANFSPKVRAVLLEQARLGKLRPGGTKSELTILFCDICAFTQKAAQMDAHDLVDMLNDYFQPLVEAIFRHDGTVDKFVGDGVLAVFGSLQADAQHHQKAVNAALAIQEVVEATSKLRAARGDVTCRVRVGLHSGEVFHGFVGAMDRLEFTVIGDAVNRACRFCQAAGEGEVLISPEVFQRVFNLVRADKCAVQTKEGELVGYRLKEVRAGGANAG